MKRSERKARHAHADALVQRLRDAMESVSGGSGGYDWWNDLLDEADAYLGIPS